MFVVPTVFFLTDSVVLIQGAELGAGSRKAMFLISAVEAGQDTLTKQILPQLHLEEEVDTPIKCIPELLIVMSFDLRKGPLLHGIIIFDAV